MTNPAETIQALESIFMRLDFESEGSHACAKQFLEIIAKEPIPGLRIVPSVGPDPRDQWYPGNDGVMTVEELWAFYCARGDSIVELRDELAAALAEVAQLRIDLREQARNQAGALEDMTNACLEAVKDRDEALAKLAQVTGERDTTYTALGECTCLMDPPDGGEPSLPELVGRMREAWKKAEDRVAQVTVVDEGAVDRACEAWWAARIAKSGSSYPNAGALPGDVLNEMRHLMRAALMAGRQ